MSRHFKLSIVVLACCSLYSCGTLKNKTMQTQTQQSTTSISEQVKASTQQNSETKLALSNQNVAAYALLIKPSGRFNYSEKDGFVGNADYVIVRGQSSHMQQSLMQRNKQSISKVEAQHELLQKTRSKQKQQQKTIKRVGIPWRYLLVALALCGLIYRFKNQLTFIFKRKEETMATKIKVYRSAITGKFVKKQVAVKAPKTTVKETVVKK